MTDLLTDVPAWTVATSVLICDDRRTARQALADLLTPPIPGAGTVGAVADGFGLLESIAARPADLVLVGLRRGVTSGPAAVDLLLGLNPSASVIVYGTSADADLLTAAISRGARGLILWDPAVRLRLPARTAAGRGQSRKDSRFDSDGGVALTERELQVLEGMSQGRSNREIGRQLFLSEDTIKSHAGRLFSKLDARDRAHAVARGLQDGMLR